jgi:hypothetical protein
MAPIEDSNLEEGTLMALSFKKKTSALHKMAAEYVSWLYDKTAIRSDLDTRAYTYLETIGDLASYDIARLAFRDAYCADYQYRYPENSEHNRTAASDVAWSRLTKRAASLGWWNPKERKEEEAPRARLSLVPPVNDTVLVEMLTWVMESNSNKRNFVKWAQQKRAKE